jgi:hypothetical protein
MTYKATKPRSGLRAGFWVVLLCGAAATGAFAAPASTPDWSGVWNPNERNLFDPSAAKGPATPGGVQSFLPDTSYEREYPPYNPDYEARYEAVLAKTKAGKAVDPTAGCVPPGMPRIMTTPYPLEFIIQPQRVTIMHEAYSQMRWIHTDGRPHPSELDPTYNGHSIGHWEGDTLVVDTVGLRGDTVFDVTGAPHSGAMHLVERIRRLNAETLEDRIVVEDKTAMTKPWTVVRTYSHRPDWQLTEYVCEENQRNPMNPDGTTGFIGPK